MKYRCRFRYVIVLKEMNDSSLSFRRLLQRERIGIQEEHKKWWCQYPKISFSYSLSLWNLNLPIMSETLCANKMQISKFDESNGPAFQAQMLSPKSSPQRLTRSRSTLHNHRGRPITSEEHVITYQSVCLWFFQVIIMCT